MHNIDRTMSMEGSDFETGDFEMGDHETSEYETEPSAYEGDFEDTFESEFGEEAADYGELSEEEEVDLAAELLTVTNEEELDQFLGNKIFRRVRSRMSRSPLFNSIVGALKGVAGQALPMVGGALGSIIAPGAGTAIGSSLGKTASRLFEVDVEAMSDEDAEFEIARRFVRLANGTVQQASNTASGADPRRAARQALVMAARRHAPGLARALDSRPRGGQRGLPGARSTGRWVRRGRTIILLGA